ncbi:MAG: hypothetical protein RLN89_02025 [Parvibaculum sp.]
MIHRAAFSFSLAVSLALAAMTCLSAFGSGPAHAETVAPVIDLKPTEEELNWAEPGTARGLNGDVSAPLDAPATTGLLGRHGISPDIRASETSIGATQQIDLGSKGFADRQGEITPYVELGAGVAKAEEEPLITGSTVNADVTTDVGGGTKISVNDQVDFKLGVTRQDTLGVDGRADNKVESGVSIKF